MREKHSLDLIRSEGRSITVKQKGGHVLSVWSYRLELLWGFLVNSETRHRGSEQPNLGIAGELKLLWGCHEQFVTFPQERCSSCFGRFVKVVTEIPVRVGRTVESIIFCPLPASAFPSLSLPSVLTV